MIFVSLRFLLNRFTSPKYLEIAPLREQSKASKSIIVEGFPLNEPMVQ